MYVLCCVKVGTCESSCGSGTTPSPSGGGGGGGGGGAPASPTQPTPTLLQSQVQRLAEAAERLVATIRPLDPKPHNVKKKLCKNLEVNSKLVCFQAYPEIQNEFCRLSTDDWLLTRYYIH